MPEPISVICSVLVLISYTKTFVYDTAVYTSVTNRAYRFECTGDRVIS